MNIIDQTYSFQKTEKRLQKFWDKNKFLENAVKSEKEPFCVMMPPPISQGHCIWDMLWTMC